MAKTSKTLSAEAQAEQFAELQEHARELGAYVEAWNTLDAKRAAAHAAAWAIKSALWVDGSGKRGRTYLPTVAAILAVAYPDPHPNASAAEKGRIRTARSKLYSVIDTTTKGKLGTRSDRRQANHVKSDKAKASKNAGRNHVEAPEASPVVVTAWADLNAAYDRLETAVAELFRLVTENRRKQALERLGEMRIMVSSRDALDKLGQALQLAEAPDTESDGELLAA